VLNFGMPAFSWPDQVVAQPGRHGSRDPQAIATFEPRIDAKSMSVQIDIDPKRHHNTLQLTLRCQMWAQAGAAGSAAGWPMSIWRPGTRVLRALG
jgi:predicted component of type VI protein secretion system